ncbi:MAG TPA: hypothetical protein VLG28_12620 [Acidimicrobiia bacterium]|jgi:hypothetical protein|nr:hypothetical protein [Acidimicrobiia bacterium]
MTSKVRSVVADVIVGVALFLVVLWVLRRLLGVVLWLGSLAALVLVVLALFALARWVRKG